VYHPRGTNYLGGALGRGTPQDPPNMREVHNATMANGYVEPKRELSMTPAGHQVTAWQPDVTNT
jgi:hypothetical protein